MRPLLLMATLVLAIALPSAANAQLNNLFKPSDTPPSDTPVEAAGPGEIDAAMIGRLLTEGGYELTNQDEGGCTFEVVYDDITYPLSVCPTGNKKICWIRVGLISIPDDPSNHTDKFMRLLELSGTYGHAFYSYNSETRMLELFSPLDAEVATAEVLKERIDAVVTQATDQAADWDTDAWTTARHVGSWSANMGPGQVMTINLRGDGSFDLTNEDAGNVTSITGQYQLEGGVLKMNDTTGNEISGEFRFTDGNHFEFNVNDRNLSFERG